MFLLFFKLFFIYFFGFFVFFFMKKIKLLYKFFSFNTKMIKNFLNKPFFNFYFFILFFYLMNFFGFGFGLFFLGLSFSLCFLMWFIMMIIFMKDKITSLKLEDSFILSLIFELLTIFSRLISLSIRLMMNTFMGFILIIMVHFLDNVYYFWFLYFFLIMFEVLVIFLQIYIFVFLSNMYLIL